MPDEDHQEAPINLTIVPDAAGIDLLRDLADALEKHIDPADQISDTSHRPFPFRKSSFRALGPTRS